MPDEQPSESLLLENRVLRDKIMRIQNLFMQLLIACYSQPNNIGSVLGEMHQALNETVALSQSTMAGTSGSGAHQPHAISPESAAAFLALPQMVTTPNQGVPNLQMLIAEMTSGAHGATLSDVPASSLTGNTTTNNMSTRLHIPAPVVASEALHDVPAKPFLDYLSSIEEIWREYRYGDPQSGRPSIIELDSKYGDKWRKKEYVPDLKELKSRQNLYNKRKCVWSEVQRFMQSEGLAEEAAIDRLQQEVNAFGKGLSRYIDTVLRDRQKARRGNTAGNSEGAGGSALNAGGVEVVQQDNHMLPAVESYRGSHVPSGMEDGRGGWGDGQHVAKRVKVEHAGGAAAGGGGSADGTTTEEAAMPRATPPPQMAPLHDTTAAGLTGLYVPTPVRVPPAATGLSFTTRDAALAALPGTEDAPHRGATAAT